MTRRPLWLMAPGGALIAVVIGMPLLLAVFISLLQLDQYTLRDWVSAPFIGIDNFVEALSDSSLPHAMWISASTSLAVTLLSLPLGVAAALACHNKMRGRGLIRSVFLIPYVLPAFVAATVWRTMLQPGGPVDTALGYDGLSLLTGPRSYWTLILVNTWMSWPFIYLMALAGLQAVSDDTIEAAAIDGASVWQKLAQVVLPQIRGIVALAVVIATLHHLNNFTLPFVLFGNPAPSDVEVLPMLVYSTSFESVRFGLGSAMAVCSLVLIAVPLFFYLRAVRLDTGEER